MTFWGSIQTVCGGWGPHHLFYRLQKVQISHYATQVWPKLWYFLCRLVTMCEMTLWPALFSSYRRRQGFTPTRSSSCTKRCVQTSHSSLLSRWRRGASANTAICSSPPVLKMMNQYRWVCCCWCDDCGFRLGSSAVTWCFVTTWESSNSLYYYTASNYFLRHYAKCI